MDGWQLSYNNSGCSFDHYNYQMQREVARYKFNAEPVACNSCCLQYPNYRMLISQRNKILCFGCSIGSLDDMLDIRQSYKEYYDQLIKKLPLPDYKIANECLQTVNTLREKTNNLLEGIRNRLNAFQNDLKQFFQQTVFICQGYIDKLKNIEESSVNSWHRHPPKLIDQEKFIFNIKQKQQLAVKIEQSLKEFQVNLPSIEQIKKQCQKYTQRMVCNRVSITSAINIRGILYQGTNDGRIIYQDSKKKTEVKAHDSLIRFFEHDGQFKLFSSSDDQFIKIWDLRGEQLKLEKAFGNIPGIRSSHRELALIDKGKRIVSTRGQFDEYKIRIWDLDTLQNCKTLVGHNGYIKGLVVTEDNQLITVSEDRYLKVWDLGSCEVVSEYFHSCKINYVFHNPQSGLICIIDQQNRAQLLDMTNFDLFNGVCTGRKIQIAAADSFIYIHNDRYLLIYSWTLSLLQKIDLGLAYAATKIIEMYSRLIITDANGSLHEFSPQCLNLNSL